MSRVPPWLPRAMVWIMGTMLVLSCLTGGVLGAGVLVLLVAAEGIRRYTLPHIREVRAAKATRIADCAPHEWGEPWEVGHPVRFGPAMGMRFFCRTCGRCGEIKHVYEDGSDYQPGHHVKPKE